MVLAWRRSKYKTIDIKGISVDRWREKKKTEAKERERTRQEKSIQVYQRVEDSYGRNNSVTGIMQYSHTTDTLTGISEEDEAGVGVLSECGVEVPS